MKEIPLNGAIEYIDTFMLTMAMTALGTDTNIEKFKQAGAVRMAGRRRVPAHEMAGPGVDVNLIYH